MNSIEQQLQRDIAAVKESVVVTESDLDHARAAIDGRITTGSRDRLVRVGVTVAAVAAAAVVGVSLVDAFRTSESAQPASPKPAVTDQYAHFLTGDAPTPEQVSGLWRVDDGTVTMLFSSNGSVQLDDSGEVVSDPKLIGSYSIDGQLITFDWNDDSPCSGRPLEMRASIEKPGLMHVVATSPSSGKCLPFGSYQTTLERALPTYRELAGIVAATAGGWKPLTDPDALAGDWLAERGGFVMEINPDGRYFVLDDSSAIVDAGEWSLRGSTLTLTSSGEWTGCGAGDVLKVGSVEQTANPGTLVFRGDVLRNDCGGAWTPDAWILIPHDGSAQG